MTSEKKQPPRELHEIDDFRAVYEVKVTKEVNRRGEAVSRGSVYPATETPRGWECTVCDVEFHQWAAAAAHLQTARPPRKDHGRAVPDLNNVVEFAREVLGFKLTKSQVTLIEAVLSGRQALDLGASGRNPVSATLVEILSRGKIRGNHSGFLVVGNPLVNRTKHDDAA